MNMDFYKDWITEVQTLVSLMHSLQITHISVPFSFRFQAENLVTFIRQGDIGSHTNLMEFEFFSLCKTNIKNGDWIWAVKMQYNLKLCVAMGWHHTLWDERRIYIPTVFNMLLFKAAYKCHIKMDQEDVLLALRLAILHKKSWFTFRYVQDWR